MSVYIRVYGTVYGTVYGAVVPIPHTRRTVYGSRTTAVLIGTDTRAKTITGNAGRSTIYGR